MTNQVSVVILIILTGWLYKYSKAQPSQPVIKLLRKYGWLIVLGCFAYLIRIQINHLFSAISIMQLVLMIVIIFLLVRSSRKNNE